MCRSYMSTSAYKKLVGIVLEESCPILAKTASTMAGRENIVHQKVEINRR